MRKASSCGDQKMSLIKQFTAKQDLRRARPKVEEALHRSLCKRLVVSKLVTAETNTRYDTILSGVKFHNLSSASWLGGGGT